MLPEAGCRPSAGAFGNLVTPGNLGGMATTGAAGAVGATQAAAVVVTLAFARADRLRTARGREFGGFPNP